MEETRKGNWIETYTGRKFWPLDPKPNEVNLNDIAHALSLICRYSGHCKHFYSVAQHSLNVSKAMEEAGLSIKLQIYGLLHDASETYICDIVRPLKHYISGYIDAEHKIQDAIYNHFGLPYPTKDEESTIKAFDCLVLHNEAVKLMNNVDHWANPEKFIDIDLKERPYIEVKIEFQFLFWRLFREGLK